MEGEGVAWLVFVWVTDLGFVEREEGGREGGR
jgi:hypothetical protein